MSRAPPPRLSSPLAVSLVLLLSIIVFAHDTLAANDPGHDSHYVLRIGDTNVTGTINLTGNMTATIVQATSRFFGPNVDIRGDGTSSGNANQLIGTATNLELSSSGNLILNKAVTGGMVYVGWLGTTTALNVTGNIIGAGTLNVSGNAYANGAQVCTASNGLCAGAGAVSAAGGWVNDSATTRTTLITIVNSSSNTGSFLVQNQTGAIHLFVNGSTGRIGVGSNNPAQSLDVGGAIAISGTTRISGTGVGTFATGTTVNALNLCLSDGTNCPASTANASWNETHARTIFGTLSQVADLQAANVTLNASLTNAATAITNLQTANTSVSASVVTANTNIAALLASAGGWTNDTTSTRTLLRTIVNSSNSAGSFLIQNQTGSNHLFVNGSSGNVGIGNARPRNALEVIGTMNATAIQVGSTSVCLSDGTNCPAASGDNASWNETRANLLYATLAQVGDLQAANVTLNGSIANARTAIGHLQTANTTLNASVVTANANIVALLTSAGGWMNTSTTTRTTLQAIVNSSNITGSLLVQNTTGSTHLFVNGSSGYVGIGTAAPSAVLEVRSTSDCNQRVLWAKDGSANDVGGFFVGCPGDNRLYVGDGTYVFITTSGVSYFNSPNGGVGIGTSVPTAKLQVNSSSAAGSLLVQNTTGSAHLFVNGSSGYVGIGTTVSTQKLHVNGSVNATGRIYAYENITMPSPNGVLWNCGVSNGGAFTCT